MLVLALVESLRLPSFRADHRKGRQTSPDKPDCNQPKTKTPYPTDESDAESSSKGNSSTADSTPKQRNGYPNQTKLIPVSSEEPDITIEPTSTAADEPELDESSTVKAVVDDQIPEDARVRRMAKKEKIKKGSILLSCALNY
jgi:hypothetical protein